MLKWTLRNPNDGLAHDLHPSVQQYDATQDRNFFINTNQDPQHQQHPTTISQQLYLIQQQQHTQQQQYYNLQQQHSGQIHYVVQSQQQQQLSKSGYYNVNNQQQEVPCKQLPNGNNTSHTHTSSIQNPDAQLQINLPKKMETKNCTEISNNLTTSKKNENGFKNGLSSPNSKSEAKLTIAQQLAADQQEKMIALCSPQIHYNVQQAQVTVNLKDSNKCWLETQVSKILK